MKNAQKSGYAVPAALAAGAILSLITFTGMYLVPGDELDNPTFDITPATHHKLLGEDFSVHIIVTSDIPVNAFKGLVSFNEDILSISNLDYNTSFADLWAKEPWYAEGRGTVSFIGGTTRSGGFTGTDALLTITFTPKAPGNAEITLKNTEILQHDGRGTTAQLTKNIDDIFLVSSTTAEKIIKNTDEKKTSVTIVETLPSPDLDGDGQVTIKDISLFFLHISQSNQRADFNNDGKVNTADLRILLDAR